MKTFIEQDCKIEHNGKEFESGGAWLLKRKDTGKYEGMVYANTNDNTVTDWHGNVLAKAQYSKPTRNNMGANIQHVWFTYQGHNFYGKYGCDWSQLIRVREIK